MVSVAAGWAGHELPVGNPGRGVLSLRVFDRQSSHLVDLTVGRAGRHWTEYRQSAVRFPAERPSPLALHLYAALLGVHDPADVRAACPVPLSLSPAADHRRHLV